MFISRQTEAEQSDLTAQLVAVCLAHPFLHLGHQSHDIQGLAVLVSLDEVGVLLGNTRGAHAKSTQAELIDQGSCTHFAGIGIDED